MKLYYIKVMIIIMSCIVITGCKKKPVEVQGFVDADYTYMASSFSGNLIRLSVNRGDKVIKGQTLFMLDDQPQKAEEESALARVFQAYSQIQQQQAEVNYQAILYKRYKELLKTHGISREEFDKVENNYLTAQAALKSNIYNMKAYSGDLGKAKWTRSNKIVVSPISGYVFDTYYTEGELVDASRPVLSLLSPENLKIVFYIDETMISTVRLKEGIEVSLDGRKEPISASVSYISSQEEYTPPYIYSEKERTKFMYRVEAKPVKNMFFELHPGQPVTIKIYHG